MFEGYIIGRREKVVDEYGDTLFSHPSIFNSVSYIRLKDHSKRLDYNSASLPPDMEVFYIKLNDADVMTVRNDPNTYMLNLDLSDFEPQPFANWLKAKGESKASFQATRAKYKQKRPEFIAALDAVEEKM